MIVYIVEAPFDPIEDTYSDFMHMPKRIGVYSTFAKAKESLMRYAEKEMGWDMSHPAWFRPKKFKKIENGKEVRTTLFLTDNRDEFFGQIESRIVEN